MVRGAAHDFRSRPRLGGGLFYRGLLKDGVGGGEGVGVGAVGDAVAIGVGLQWMGSIEELLLGGGAVAIAVQVGGDRRFAVVEEAKIFAEQLVVVENGGPEIAVPPGRGDETGL